MNIREANKKIKELENDYDYWLKEKEKILTLVLPKSTDIRPEKVDGGNREDRLIKYVEADEERQINVTLDYIISKKQNLENWVERELKIIGEYEPLKAKVIKLRDIEKLTWKSIAEATNYSESQVRRIYKLYTSKRDIY